MYWHETMHHCCIHNSCSLDSSLHVTLFSLPCYLFEQDADTQRVMLRLSKEYPGDLGILMPLMLNLLQLKPGLAFFMTVDEPHAYLRGDILEARWLASSVVVRGLLPVFRDLSMLIAKPCTTGGTRVLKSEIFALHTGR